MPKTTVHALYSNTEFDDGGKRDGVAVGVKQQF
ncbi:hypothetical protein THIOSC13_880001 [uncultured Thiomicrorhabdus sp.]